MSLSYLLIRGLDIEAELLLFHFTMSRLDLIRLDYFICLSIFKILHPIPVQLALSLLLKYDVFDPARRFRLLSPSVVEPPGCIKRQREINMRFFFVVVVVNYPECGPY